MAGIAGLFRDGEGRRGFGRRKEWWNSQRDSQGHRGYQRSDIGYQKILAGLALVTQIPRLRGPTRQKAARKKNRAAPLGMTSRGGVERKREAQEHRSDCATEKKPQDPGTHSVPGAPGRTPKLWSPMVVEAAEYRSRKADRWWPGAGQWLRSGEIFWRGRRLRRGDRGEKSPGEFRRGCGPACHASQAAQQCRRPHQRQRQWLHPCRLRRCRR